MKKKTSYRPTQKVLENYAKVLVNFALNSGEGVRKGETVVVNISESAKPLYGEILKAIWKAGGHVIPKYHPDDEPDFKFDRMFYEHAEDHQLEHFPAKYLKGMVDQADHIMFVISETDKHSLKGIDPNKMMKNDIAHKPYYDWRNKKEHAGKFTWTVALYGTPAAAKEVKLTEKEYWDQIIKACYLDAKDPIAKWKSIYSKMREYIAKLNNLKIEKLHILGKDADLWIKLGEKRKWIGGGGRNIPSFEIFTSPDWRGTEGWIRFNQPLYAYGNLIDGVELEFKDGVVTKSSAKKNAHVLKSMIASPHADKVGEFSLTDKRFSRITKFMGETLFDENVGGPFGNTHIALGSAYHDCYDGDPGKVAKKEWQRLGYNDSAVHTDIVSTADRTVTAFLKDGSSRVIYEKGRFIC